MALSSPDYRRGYDVGTLNSADIIRKLTPKMEPLEIADFLEALVNAAQESERQPEAPDDPNWIL